MAGYLALLLSAIPVEYRLSYMNLGGVRHLLQECCIPLSNNSIYEQGMGLFQFSLAKERLIAKFGKSLVSKGIVWTPKAKEMLGAHASVYPFQIFINTSYESCAFWWPHCTFDRSGKANPPLSLNFNLVISFPLSPVFSVDAVEYVSEFGEKALWVVNEVSSLWPFVGVLKLFISFPNLADSNNTLAESSIRRMKGKFYISVSSCVGKYRMTTCVHLDWCAYRNEKR